jgi:hypothetical protein
MHLFYNEKGEECGTSWTDDLDGIASTGQRRFALVPSARLFHSCHTKFNTTDARGILIMSNQLNDEIVAALWDVVRNTRAEVCKLPGCENARVHELEIMVTPGGAGRQRKHRDGNYDWMNVVISLHTTKQRTRGTWCASDYRPPPAGMDNWSQDLESFNYERLTVPAGGGCAFHGCLPHYGPGNLDASEDRFVLFLVFALNKEAEMHFTDDAVVWD